MEEYKYFLWIGYFNIGCLWLPFLRPGRVAICTSQNGHDGEGVHTKNVSPKGSDWQQHVMLLVWKKSERMI